MKLFSTSNRLIPTKLKIVTKPVIKKIEIWLFIEIFEKKEVIIESLFSLREIFSFGTKLSKVGSNVNVIMNEVTSPKVIIHPKSIIGFISLNIKERKAIIVVKTVYKIGQNIFFVVSEINSKKFLLGNFSFSCKNLVLI